MLESEAEDHQTTDEPFGVGDQPDNTTVLPRLWQEFIPRIHEINPASGACRYGAWNCLPHAERSDPDELLYVAGLGVALPVTIPPGMVQWTAAPSRYARFIHSGPALRLGDTIEYIYALWLPRAGLERGTSFGFESYDQRFSVANPHSEIAYFVPLAS